MRLPGGQFVVLSDVIAEEVPRGCHRGIHPARPAVDSARHSYRGAQQQGRQQEQNHERADTDTPSACVEACPSLTSFALWPRNNGQEAPALGRAAPAAFEQGVPEEHEAAGALGTVEHVQGQQDDT